MLSLWITDLANTLGIFYYILVYAIGIVSMALSVCAFQFRYRITIVICNFLGQASWVVYFLLQGDLTSAIACALCAVMISVFTKRDKWRFVKSPFCTIFFIILICGFSAFSFATWADVFPILAGVFAVIANSRAHEKELRIFSIFWCGFWLLNSAFKMYPVALVNDLFCTVSTIVALIRYRKTKKYKNNE